MTFKKDIIKNAEKITDEIQEKASVLLRQAWRAIEDNPQRATFVLLGSGFLLGFLASYAIHHQKNDTRDSVEGPSKTLCQEGSSESVFHPKSDSRESVSSAPTEGAERIAREI